MIKNTTIGRKWEAMSSYYLAIDIGASSGRHILGSVKDRKITLEEVHRFENGMIRKDGHLCWDLDYLFSEIKKGLKRCMEIGKPPASVGIDTWAVDYVLLDADDQIIGNTYAYRDGRTKGMDWAVYQLMPLNDLYARTGIQKQIFNTIYQLMATKEQEPENLAKAKTLLMLPDYFHFLLTGQKVSEYTNATSSQLVDPLTYQWDMELIELLGYQKGMFLPLSLPGTPVGAISKELSDEIGYTCTVVLPATHDTASAVVSVPAESEDYLYISSGTWSLMGIENKTAICNAESMAKNFTNEGGYDYRYRYLKNIMGLWMIQSVRKELEHQYTFVQLCEMAEENRLFPSRVDVNDDRFLAPESMIEAIQSYCELTGQAIPKTHGQLAAVIYQSLAKSYGETVAEIEALSGRKFDCIHIVGGGSNAEYLNQLTAEKTKKVVYAGPGEATAIGNLAVQMMKAGEFDSLSEVRACIYNSFEIKKYS